MRQLKISILLILLSTIGYSQVDINAHPSVKNLYNNLMTVKNSNEFFFGQEFYNSFKFNYGVHDDESFSDCKSIIGEHPAVLGQDFHYYIYKTDDEARSHKEAAINAFAEGCVITFDFHINGKNGNSTSYSEADKYLMYNIGNLDDSNGELSWYNGVLDEIIDITNKDLNIPIVFRLYHEMNGNWFWWGSKAYGGSEAYIKFYRYTVNYIKTRTNWMLFAWSPDKDLASEYYPGDDYVDFVGLDGYDMDEVSYYSSSDMISDLTDIVDFAESHNKVAIFSETGNRINSPDKNPDWWINSVYTPIVESDRAWKIAWILTWINSNWADQPYIPYSGSSNEAKEAFVNFSDKPQVLFQSEVENMNIYDELSTPIFENRTDIDNSSKLLVFPNPANERITIESMGIMESITLFDLSGRPLMLSGAINSTNYTMDVSSLSEGIYFLQAKKNETNNIIQLQIY